MQSAVVIRLRPLGPWRCGMDGARQGVDPIFRSDRLYSAITLAMQRLGLLSEWLGATALSSAPAVTCSSMFPFQGDTLFAPPPTIAWPPAPSLLTSPSPVFLSKIRWSAARFVPVSLTESLMMGQQILADQWVVDSESGCLLRRDRPSSSPFRYSSRSRAAVDRVTGNSGSGQAYGCIEFESGSGLWCVVRFADDAARSTWGDRVGGAFRLLADTGFGGNRSSGWGQTAVPEFEGGVWPNVLMPKLERASRTQEGTASGEDGQTSLFWLLSLYSPAQKDSVDWNEGDYQLTVRGGQVDSSAGFGQKKAVRMVAEGSVLSSRDEPVGAAVDVAPDGFAHPVYRAGFALSCKLPSLEQVARWQGPVETTPLTPLADPGAAGDEGGFDISESCDSAHSENTKPTAIGKTAGEEASPEPESSPESSSAAEEPLSDGESSGEVKIERSENEV